MAWADFHLKVMSPQILLMPDREFFLGGKRGWGDLKGAGHSKVK